MHTTIDHPKERRYERDCVAWTVDMMAAVEPSLGERVSILVGIDVLTLLAGLSKQYLNFLVNEDPSFPPKAKVGSRALCSLTALRPRESVQLFRYRKF